MNKLTLGAPMIVKDEIRCIDRCLETLVGNLDEIVIVDTGSTDGTLERLRFWEAAIPQIRVYEKKWTGNFAEMRNYAQTLVSTDWLFIIDGDEWVPDPNRTAGESPWNLIWQALVEKGDEADGFYCDLNNLLPEGQILAGDTNKMLRFIYNKPEFKWSGGTHNQVQRSIINNPRGKKVQWGYIGICIEHDGYDLTPEEKEAKFRPRLPSLIQEVNIHKSTGNEDLEAYYTFQLANCHYMLTDYESCLSVYSGINWDKLQAHNKFSALQLAVTSAIQQEDKEMMDVYSTMLLQVRPNEPISILQRGLVEMKQENFIDAYTFLITALCLNQHEGVKKTAQLDTEYVAGMLAECLTGAQQYHEAVVFSLLCLSKYPNHQRANQILRYMLEEVRVRTSIDFEGDPSIEVNEDEKEN